MQQTTIDGVTCFWVDSGRPTLTARLLFRGGSADEPLHESGWLHLLEHAVLHGRGGGTLHVNGFVSPLVTAFDAHGPAEAVAQHLTEVTAALHRLDPTRLKHERDVLRAEGDMRGGPSVRAFSWRYGARGPGVIAMGEPGLGRAEWQRLQERAHSVFTRGNAALVLDGPVPEGMRLDLPEGELLPIPRADACQQQLPAWYVDDSLVLSGVVRRSNGATILPDLLERGLRVRLREEAAGSYAPWATYEPADADRAQVIAGADASRALMPTLADQARQLVDQLAQGPDPAWLDDVKAMRRQAMLDPYALVGTAMRAAHDHLRGLPVLTREETLAELDATTVEEVQGLAQEFASSMLLGLPGEAMAPTDIPRVTQPVEQGAVFGRRFRRADWPATTHSLVVDDEDAHLLEGDQYTCFHADDVAGMLSWDDGGRHLITYDGWGLTVEPSHWRRGHRAVEALDAMVPAARQLPMPSRDPVEPPALPHPVTRWWRAIRRPWSASALATWATLLLLAALATFLTAGSPSVLSLIVIGYFFYAAWKRHRARTYRGRTNPSASSPPDS